MLFCASKLQLFVGETALLPSATARHIHAQQAPHDSARVETIYSVLLSTRETCVGVLCSPVTTYYHTMVQMSRKIFFFLFVKIYKVKTLFLCNMCIFTIVSVMDGSPFLFVYGGHPIKALEAPINGEKFGGVFFCPNLESPTDRPGKPRKAHQTTRPGKPRRGFGKKPRQHHPICATWKQIPTKRFFQNHLYHEPKFSKSPIPLGVRFPYTKI